jgi:hypothetical protein
MVSMKRVVTIAACGLSLAACSGMPSWMQLDMMPKSAPAATTMQFESEPAGAEARTSLGQSCRTPCTMAMASSEFTVSFALPGYQPQTVPVRVVASADGADGEARLVPNPVFVELRPGAPAPSAKKPAPKKNPARAAPRAAPTAMAPEPSSPAPAPASPWPPAR